MNPPNLSLNPVEAGLPYTTVEMESIPSWPRVPALSFLAPLPVLGFPGKFTQAPEFLNPLPSTSVVLRQRGASVQGQGNPEQRGAPRRPGKGSHAAKGRFISGSLQPHLVLLVPQRASPSAPSHQLPLGTWTPCPPGGRVEWKGEGLGRPCFLTELPS